MGEFFPWWDDPEASKVSGLMEAAVPPAPAAPLRTETGFGEIPGVGHQGGSSLAVSKYSKNQDAAWLFAQWATSFDTQVYITESKRTIVSVPGLPAIWTLFVKPSPTTWAPSQICQSGQSLPTTPYRWSWASTLREIMTRPRK